MTLNLIKCKLNHKSLERNTLLKKNKLRVDIMHKTYQNPCVKATYGKTFSSSMPEM
jgi:hypothetical protein